MLHTNFARVRSKAPFGSPCAQPSHPLRLLVTKLPSSATSMPVWDQFAHPALEFTIRRSRTGTVPCSSTPLKGAIWLRPPSPQVLRGRRSMAPNIALTTPVSLTNCTKQWPSLTLSRTKRSLRGTVSHECVVARLQLVKDATSQSMHTSCPQPDKSTRHLSQMMDISMLRERCKTEFRKRLGKHKSSPGISLSAAIRAFGRPCKVPVAPWISKRTWEIVQLERPIMKFMRNVRKRSKTAFMSVAFFRWLSLFSIPFSPGESVTTVCRGRWADHDGNSTPAKVAETFLQSGCR